MHDERRNLHARACSMRQMAVSTRFRMCRFTRQRGPSGGGAVTGTTPFCVQGVGYPCRVPSVFLSHSRRDAEVARRLHARLDAEGVPTWLDQAELLPGDSLIGKIQQAIAEFDYLAVLLSPASVTSSWVATEVQAALNQEIEHRRIKVIPILVEPCEVPLFLRDKLYVDLTQDFEAGVALLLRRLNPRPEVAAARRLFSYGYGRWNRSGRVDRHLQKRHQPRDVSLEPERIRHEARDEFWARGRHTFGRRAGNTSGS